VVKDPVAAARKNKRRVGPGVIVVGILILVLAGGVAIQYWRTNSGVSLKNAGAEPAMITGPGNGDKGVTVGSADAKAKIEVYVDFRCPHCQEFEDEVGPTINQLVDEGKVQLTYNPLAFVNEEASPRLANAFGCAAAAGKARGFHDQLFADFVKSWTTDQLLELGKKLGITDAGFEKCVRDGGQRGWIEAVGKAAEARGVTGTPTVYINGKVLPEEDYTPEKLKAAVEAN
jgi:protein-disulfide isomerase